MAKSPLNEEIIIKNNKVYTSYFARASKIIPDRRLISISRGNPEGWKCGFLRELNPSESLFFAYKYHGLSEEEFESTYRLETLDNLNPNEIYEKSKGKVLCCWEKTGEFCHRHFVLKWLAEHLGNEIIGGEI